MVVMVVVVVSSALGHLLSRRPSLVFRNNGRHLWRRLPASAKEEGGELAALWGVGKCLWKR